MNATQELINKWKQAENILIGLDAWEKQAFKEFNSSAAEIARCYQSELNALTNEAKKLAPNGGIPWQKAVKNARNDIKTAEKYLSLFGNEVPGRFNEQYYSLIKLDYEPEEPDFNTIDALLRKLNDRSFLASIIRIFKLRKPNDNSFLALIMRIFKLEGYSDFKTILETLASKIGKALAFLREEKARCDAFYSAMKEYEFIKNAEKNKVSADSKLLEVRKKYEEALLSVQTELNQTLENFAVLKDFAETRESLLERLGFFGNPDVYSPPSAFHEALIIGAIAMDMDQGFSFYPVIKKYIRAMSLFSSPSQKILVPVCVGSGSSMGLAVLYGDKDAARNIAMSAVQGIVLQIVKTMPANSYSITYIDPIDRGANLGKLRKLADGASQAICRIYASDEDISKRLREFEKFVDATCARLGGANSVYEYEAEGNPLVERHFLIINDFPERLERRSRELLDIILNNASRCGISVILTSAADCFEELPEIARKSFTHIGIKNDICRVELEDKLYPFVFDDEPQRCDAFLEDVKKAYSEGSRIDNRFSYFHDLTEPKEYDDSIQILSLPVSVDARGSLFEIEVGSGLSAHALLSGQSGSGKSNMLHTIINSILMKYHPDDVELWLVDYKKVEFAEYAKNMPPHIRLIGLEQSPEFTFSLLDMTYGEIQRRDELFRKNGVRDIESYKKKFGSHSLPRVILIVDEFHHMAQAVQNENQYKIILENILSEARSFGISCIFSDQAVTLGLQGFTEKGKKQIGVRIALKNDTDEIRGTLGGNFSEYNDESTAQKIRSMKQGDFMLKRTFTDERGESQTTLDKYLGLRILDEDIRGVTEYAQRKFAADFTPKDVIILEGLKRKVFSEAETEKTMAARAAGKKKAVPLFVGSPVTLEPCFSFSLEKGPDANIMLVGSDNEMRASVIYHAILSFKQIPGNQALILAGEDDDLYREWRHVFSKLYDDNAGEIVGIKNICGALSYYSSYKEVQDSRLLLVWLGIENLAIEFLELPEMEEAFRVNRRGKTPASDHARSQTDMDLDSMLGEIRNEAAGASEERHEDDASGDEEDVRLFNGIPVIQGLLSHGYRSGLYSMITYASVKQMKTRGRTLFDQGLFEHKIALKMSREDSTNYLGRGEYASSLDEISAVYYDGGSSLRRFRPYLLTDGEEV
jgi:hypothetical protein